MEGHYLLGSVVTIRFAFERSKIGLE